MPYYIIPKNAPTWRSAEPVHARTAEEAIRSSRLMERLLVEAAGAGKRGAHLSALVSKFPSGKDSQEYRLFMQIIPKITIEAVKHSGLRST